VLLCLDDAAVFDGVVVAIPSDEEQQRRDRVSLLLPSCGSGGTMSCH
jgi:hypothetical protein